jgi:methionyl-tRNA formyltransferase
LNIVFFGTADFGIETLKAILNSQHKISAIVTNPPKPAGRGLRLQKSAVNIFAEENNLSPVFTPQGLKDEDFISQQKKSKQTFF